MLNSELAKRLREWAESDGIRARLSADLLAAAEVVEAADWKPISEAPKDGTTIDVWEPRNGRTADAKWIDGHWREWGPGSFDTMCWVYIRPEPTHYRPISAPPEVKA